MFVKRCGAIEGWQPPFSIIDQVLKVEYSGKANGKQRYQTQQEHQASEEFGLLADAEVLPMKQLRVNCSVHLEPFIFEFHFFIWAIFETQSY